jgi:hypothetical protein
MFNILNDGVVVDKNYYYTNNELSELKVFVLKCVVRKKEQKLSNITDKIKRLKLR